MPAPIISRLKLRTKLIPLLGVAALAVVMSMMCGATTVGDRVTGDRVDKLRAVVQSTFAIARGLEAQVDAKRLTRDIGNLLNGLRDTMARLAGGDLTIAIPGIERKDELGAMARAVGVFKENANRIAKLEQEQQSERERAAEEKRRLLVDLADRFDQQVRSVVETVASAGPAEASSYPLLTAATFN